MFKNALRKVFANGSVRLGGGVLLLLILMSIFAPWLGTIDPTMLDPGSQNLLPGTTNVFMTLDGDEFEHFFLMGSDSLGRDIWSRTLYGGRVSITLGISVALLAVFFGTVAGLLSGYFRWVDAVMMRVMDGFMSIPAILFAISLIAMFGNALVIVVTAIAIPSIPRIARLVRSVVLSVREEPYVEAAIPNATAPLIVQGTYVCAEAILVEAILSFLGVGMPVEAATWGNIMAEGRSQFNAYPHMVLLPGIFLVLTILSVNILGDGLRDSLDPKFSKRSDK